jgi:hypothetical protein
MSQNDPLSDEIVAWLKDLFKDADGSPRLTKWQEQFMADMKARFEQYGATTRISPRQMESLQRVEQAIHA